MTKDIIAFGIFVYFLGLVFSGGFALIRNQWQKSIQLFVLVNLIGFVSGLAYLISFAPNEIELANFVWLFQFSPTINLLGGIFFALISGISALVGIYSFRYLEIYKEVYNPSVVQLLSVIFVFGMQGVLLANNSFVFLFFWELMSVASFFLVFADKTKQSIHAAFLYFVMTHLGAAAIMGGFMILGGGFLIFDFANISGAAASLSPSMALLAFFLFFFGFGSKAGLVPFHVWLPEAHPEAPSNISAMMSGLMLKVAVFGFIKIIFAFKVIPDWAAVVVIALGLVSAVVGALYAVLERDIKRTFAYSSIENMGIIFTMLGVALYLMLQGAGSQVDAIAMLVVVFAIFHALNHAFFKTALFLSSGIIISRFHTRRLETMGGLAKIMPFFSFAFLVAILSSLPLAPFGSFFGEWGLVQSILNLLHISELNSVVMIVLLAILAIVGLVSGLAVFAMVKVFAISMLGLPRTKHLVVIDEKQDALLIVPVFILGFGVLILGIFAKSMIAWLSGFGKNLVLIGLEDKQVVLSQLSSCALFFVLSFLLVATYLVYKYFAKEKNIRTYQTWDCGQAINSTMEYTATAFSGPIRFFFIHPQFKNLFLKSEPVVQANPWIRKYVFSLSYKSIWKERLYRGVANIFQFMADKARVIQGGRIQYYLLFVLVTLVATLIIVL